MKTVWEVQGKNDIEAVRNQRTVNKSYAGFYMFVAMMIAIAAFLIQFFSNMF